MNINIEALLAELKAQETRVNTTLARQVLGKKFRIHRETIMTALETAVTPLRAAYVADFKQHLEDYLTQATNLELEFTREIYEHGSAMLTKALDDFQTIQGASMTEWEYHASLEKPEKEIVDRITNLFEDTAQQREALQKSIQREAGEGIKRLTVEKDTKKAELVSKYEEIVTDITAAYMKKYEQVIIPILEEFKV